MSSNSRWAWPLSTTVELAPPHAGLTTASRTRPRRIPSAISASVIDVTRSIYRPCSLTHFPRNRPLLLALALFIGAVIAPETASALRVGLLGSPTFHADVEPLSPAANANIRELGPLMVTLMDGWGLGFKIRQAIVGFDAILVVNVFVGFEIAAENDLHQQAVF